MSKRLCCANADNHTNYEARAEPLHKDDDGGHRGNNLRLYAGKEEATKAVKVCKKCGRTGQAVAVRGG